MSIEVIEELGKMYRTRRGDHKTTFTCPICDGQNIFFTQSPPKCEVCGVALPDIKEMRTSLAARIAFHES